MLDLTDTVIADRYAVERELGRGGMATVWLARDLRYDRQVALKVLHPDLAGAIGVDRFLREIRVSAQLQHPNIVPILDSGTLTGEDRTELPWYAMTFLSGESLRDKLTREQQLSVDDAVRITLGVADALRYAHARGIVHRDVKPENVFLSDDRVYVVDFGIAKALSETDADRLTKTGMAVGTPFYMSPEQATAGRIDARTDQYSLAAVLYEMLAGEPPFTGPTAQAIVARQLTEPPRALIPVRPTLPAATERAVLKGLERIPADRFPDLGAFAAALQDGDTPQPAVRRGRLTSYRFVVAVAFLVVVGLAAWSVTSLRGRGRAPRVRDPETMSMYRRGLRAYERRTPGGVLEAITTFNAVIGRDSSFGLAWAALAKAYVRAHEREFAIPGLSPDNLLQRALGAVDRAIALDSSDSDAWLTQGIVSQRVDPTDLAPALRSVRRAIALDSTRAEAWHFFARFTAEAGDLPAAIQAWRRCVSLDPKYAQGLAFLAWGHYWHRAFDSAEVWADSAVAIDPNYLLGRGTLGTVAVELGQYARAAAAFDAARRLSTDVEVVNALAGQVMAEARGGRRAEARSLLRKADSLAAGYLPVSLHVAVFLAQGHVALGESETALNWLTRFQPVGDLHFQLHLRCDPPFDAIRGNPRFRSLLAAPGPGTSRGC